MIYVNLYLNKEVNETPNFVILRGEAKELSELSVLNRHYEKKKL